MAAIILDFDGTIADSFDFIVDFVTQEAGQPPLGTTEKQALRGQSMAAIARNFGHPWWRLLGLFFRGRRQMHQAINRVKPFDGVPDVIRKLHAEGHELFIVTSNTVPNVHKFLHHHHLHENFLEVYGGVGLFGKARALKRLLKEQNFERVDALYIGDEVRDIKAAESVPLRIIAVTWGFAQPADLEALQPTALVSHPADLIRILEEL